MNTLQREILSLAVDDYTGLWDVAAIVEELQPNRSELEIRDSARQALRDLVGGGALELFVGEWTGTSSGPSRAPGGGRVKEDWSPQLVSAGQIPGLLDDLSNYARPPIRDTLVFVLATAVGRAAYEDEAEV